jgi:hypothetical protein
MEEKIEILVGRGETKVTVNPLEYLRTKDLDACIGLALYENIGGKKGESVRKRGMGHLIYSGDSKEYDYSTERKSFILPESQKREAEQFIEGLLKDFENPEIFVIANRFLMGPNGGYSNPMFEYVLAFLAKKRIPIKFSDANKYIKREKETIEIVYKDMVMLHEKMKVLYKDSSDIILNHPYGSYRLESQGEIFPYDGLLLE